MKQQTALQPEFDAYAENYEEALQKGLALSGEGREFFAAARIKWLRRRLNELSFAPASVLDFGCGTGTSVPLLSDLPGVRQVTGVEVSEQSIKQARQRYPSERLRFALVDELQPDASFDLAFCNGVFHHIPPAERGEALAYILQSLRAGGVFAFWENNPWNPGTRMIMRRIPFDRDAIPLSPPEARRLLTSAGFHILHNDFAFFFPRFLRWFRSLERALHRVPFGAQYLILAKKRP